MHYESMLLSSLIHQSSQFFLLIIMIILVVVGLVVTWHQLEIINMIRYYLSCERQFFFFKFAVYYLYHCCVRPFSGGSRGMLGCIPHRPDMRLRGMQSLTYLAL